MIKGNVVLKTKEGLIIIDLPLWVLILVRVYSGEMKAFNKDDCQLFVDGNEVEPLQKFEDE